MSDLKSEADQYPEPPPLTRADAWAVAQWLCGIALRQYRYAEHPDLTADSRYTVRYSASGLRMRAADILRAAGLQPDGSPEE